MVLVAPVEAERERENNGNDNGWNGCIRETDFFCIKNFRKVSTHIPVDVDESSVLTIVTMALAPAIRR